MNRFMTLLLVLALGLAAASAPALAQATPPYKRTILVGGGANPQANGTQLLNALLQIGETGPNNRWLVRLEPGIYDLDLFSLAMKNFVDVEGSGRGVTTITSKANLTILCPPEVSAELRDLTVENSPAAGTSEGILVESSKARITRVNVQARGTLGAHAIRVHNFAEVVTPVLTDLQLTASNTSANHYATGLLIATANPVARNVSVTINDSPNIEAISVSLGSSALLEEMEISVSGNCQVCTGIGIQNSSLKLTRSRVAVTGYWVVAVQHGQTGTVEISHSSLSATTRSSTTGHGIQEVGTGTLLVEHSTVEGRASRRAGASIYSVGGAKVRVGASRLVGPVRKGLPTDPPSIFTCQGAYNGNFQPLGTSCQ